MRKFEAMSRLDRNFYRRGDVVEIARDLLGKTLVTRIDGRVTAGKIVETEAYSGRNDRACHAHLQRRTRRTRVMFEEGGKAYVYLCYGIHHLFNIVTNREGLADAVLVRALEPVEGVDLMLKRRGMEKLHKRLTAGPGVLSQAMGIHTDHYGLSLVDDHIWLESGAGISNDDIHASARIGVDYAGEDALKPWRFYIKENPWISRR